MNCCVNCFSDEQIKKIIVDNGHIGDCDFCGEKQVPVCSVDEATDISDLISDVLSVYEENERGRPLFSAIIEDWNIFRKDLPSSAKLIEAFCSTIYDDSSANYNVSVEIPRAQLEEYGIFSGHTWGEFSNAIKRKNRFHNNYFKADRFSPFLGYSIRKYPKGTKLYRARICNDIKGFEKSEMGAPPAHLRKAGRVNPEGIGVLYLTSDEQTALSEVRAGTFDYVTIGTFQLKKEIRVVNISELNKISPVLYSSNIESLSANTKIFRDIANEIAKPLRRNDSALAYLPTQFITEFIKSNGYAGVAYTSTMRTEGINVAVFDESIFECVAVHTVEINNISYSYEKITYGQQK